MIDKQSVGWHVVCLRTKRERVETPTPSCYRIGTHRQTQRTVKNMSADKQRNAFLIVCTTHAAVSLSTRTDYHLGSAGSCLSK